MERSGFLPTLPIKEKTMSNEFKGHDKRRRSSQDDSSHRLDLQYLELIETVLACEKTARQLDRIDSAIKYGR